MVTDGIVFEVQPFVSADQKYVTLEVLPSIVRFLRVNTVDIVQSQVLTTTGGVPVIVTTVNTLRLPESAIRGIQTTVSIPDGGTLLVGGMSDTRETKGYAGVPVVERIPLVKYLFSNWGESNRRHNLVMLIRTDVLIVDEYEPMRGAAMAP
jgi:type II secretory pathway component GspD/PulD (secretin)